MTGTGNRYGMGIQEQVLEFETGIRAEPDRYLLASLADPRLPDDMRAFFESVLRERPRSSTERAVLESLIEDRRHGRTKTFYMIACLECGDPERPLPMPFGDQAERGTWASAHTRGTGHDTWRVWEETK